VQTGRKEKGDPLNSAIDKMTKKTRDLRRQVSGCPLKHLDVVVVVVVCYCPLTRGSVNTEQSVCPVTGLVGGVNPVTLSLCCAAA